MSKKKKKRASLECGWVGEVWKDGGGVRIGGVEKQIPNFLLHKFSSVLELLYPLSLAHHSKAYSLFGYQSDLSSNPDGYT